MSIDNEPLMTDIYEMIRAKIAANSTLTGYLGSSPLRVFRSYPEYDVTYPLIVMVRTSRDDTLNPEITTDYFVELIIYSTSSDRSIVDTIEKNLQDVFNTTNTFNQDNTKIERLEVTGGAGQYFDSKHKAWIVPLTLRIRARRKTLGG